MERVPSGSGRWTVALWVAMFLARSPVAFAEDGRPVRMRLELELDRPTCRTFENFTVMVRIVNLNPFPVILPGFEMGYIEPEVHVLGPDGEYHKLYYGAHDSAWTKIPITIAGRGVIERHRFVYSDFSHERWPNEAGSFTLRCKTHISSCRLTGDGEDHPIEWELPEATIRVDAASVKDRQAMEFLQRRFAEGPADESRRRWSGAFRAEVFAGFLQRYGDTAYAPEIRWEAAKLLEERLGNKAIPQAEVAAMVDLFEECLTFCLGKGGAFAEEFLTWDVEGGGGNVLEVVMEHNRTRLFKQLIEELDQKYPADDEAIRYRRLLLVGATESSEKAAEEAKAFRERFPNGKYGRHLDGALRFIERQRASNREDQSTP